MELKKDRVIKLFNELGIETQPYERNPKLIQISKEDCQKIGKDELWKNWTDEERGMVSLYMPLMIMPFDELHRCMEVALGRSVWTHEMGLNCVS